MTIEQPRRRRRGNREGSVQYRRAENRYRGEMILNGKRRYFYGDTRADVLEQFAKARKLQEMGVPVDAGSETLKKFLTRWLEDSVKPRSKPRTHALYKQQVESHIIPAVGDVRLDKLTPQIVQQKLIASKLAEGLAPRTVCHLRAVLRPALPQAEKWLLVQRNVVKLTEAPRRKKPTLCVLTPEQARQFIQDSGQYRLGTLFCTMLA